MIGLCALPARAQDKVRHVAVELLGAQSAVGINYDSRFKGNDAWGYRVGLGFGFSRHSGFFGDSEEINGVGAPIEINYLLGRKNSKLELGLGANLGVYHIKESFNMYYAPSEQYPQGQVLKVKDTRTSFGYYIFGNVGYRYQRPKGFVFRIGLSPSFNFGDKYGIKKIVFFPYIGAGWSF